MPSKFNIYFSNKEYKNMKKENIYEKNNGF